MVTDGSSAGRSVVVGFDASATSRAALAYASGWAQRNGASLVIVHVDSRSGVAVLEALSAVAPVDLPGATPSDMAAEVASAMAGVPVRWRYLAATGAVTEQLESVADCLRADAIIVGRSRRGIRALRNSVARRLASAPRRIIVVVP